MTGSLLKGGLVGGIILFAWSSIAWMALPYHDAALNAFPDDAALRQVLSGVSKAGIYTLPSPKAMEASQGQPLPGPSLFVALKPAVDVSMGPLMGVQFAIQFVAALLGTWLLLNSKLSGYGGKVCFFAVLGLTIGIAGHLPAWNWWGFSAAYTLGEIADLIVGWALAGAAIAKLVR